MLTSAECTGLSLAFVFAVFFVIAAPVAVVSHFYGEGETYVHYLQKYMDEVLCARAFAFSSLILAHNQLYRRLLILSQSL